MGGYNVGLLSLRRTLLWCYFYAIRANALQRVRFSLPIKLRPIYD
jgi:hypothetical protein